MIAGRAPFSFSSRDKHCTDLWDYSAVTAATEGNPLKLAGNGTNVTAIAKVEREFSSGGVNTGAFNLKQIS
jgi:hypothetical protein